MQLLQNGVDRTVIALWLGHESVETTQMYLHADMQIKERALARTTPAGVTPGRYCPTDRWLLAFLEGLWLYRPTRPRPCDLLRNTGQLTAVIGIIRQSA
jgi:hypothetical protein